MWRYHPRSSSDSCDSCSERYNSSEEEEEGDPRTYEDRCYWPFHDLGRPTDMLVPKGAHYQELGRLLGKSGQTQGLYSIGDAAEMLPGLPGLSVRGVGYVSLPLRQENAGPVEALADKVRDNVWLVPADLVEMKNPEWDKGIRTLTKFSAEILGFRDVNLFPVLTMVLLCGPGGKLDKQPAQDPTGRSVATLVVHLPSVYTGGKMVVNDESGLQEFQYDFGKEEGMVEFKPHYAVYPTGAFRTVEEVTSGYQMVAVYSLCLPQNLPSFSGVSARCLLQVQVSLVIKKMVVGMIAVACGKVTSGNGVLALTLSQECTEEGIKANGLETLTGLDRSRLQILTAANALVPPRNQLKLYFARLRYRCAYYSGKATETALWYSSNGAELGGGNETSIEWTKKFNFLNPDNETFGRLWRNETGLGHGDHKRFAIVGWPLLTDVRNTFKWIGEIAAANIVFSGDVVDATRLQVFLQCEANRQAQKKNQYQALYGCANSYVYGYGFQSFNQRNSQTPDGPPMSLELCKKLCKAVSDAGGVNLVNIFFEVCFPRLQEKRQLIPSVAAIVRSFRWEQARASVESAIDRLPGAERLGFVLTLMDELQSPVVAPLISFAVKKAKEWSISSPCDVASSGDVGKLWKYVAECGSLEILRDFGNLFKQMDRKLLHPVVNTLSKLVDEASPQEQRALLAGIISLRREWLTAEMLSIQKPFTCQILDNNFPNAAELVVFLKGPNESCIIRGFNRITEARSRVFILKSKIRGQIEVIAEGCGRNSIARVIKRGGSFDPRRGKLPEYKAEYDQLNQLSSCLLATAQGLTISSPLVTLVKPPNSPLPIVDGSPTDSKNLAGGWVNAALSRCDIMTVFTAGQNVQADTGTLGSNQFSVTQNGSCQTKVMATGGQLANGGSDAQLGSSAASTTSTKLTIGNCSVERDNHLNDDNISTLMEQVAFNRENGNKGTARCEPTSTTTSAAAQVEIDQSKKRDANTSQSAVSASLSQNGVLDLNENNEKRFDAALVSVGHQIRDAARIEDKGNCPGVEIFSSAGDLPPKRELLPARKTIDTQKSRGGLSTVSASMGQLHSAAGSTPKDASISASNSSHGQLQDGSASHGEGDVGRLMTPPATVIREPNRCSPTSGNLSNAKYRDRITPVSAAFGQLKKSGDPGKECTNDENAHANSKSTTIGKKRLRESDPDLESVE